MARKTAPLGHSESSGIASFGQFRINFGMPKGYLPKQHFLADSSDRKLAKRCNS
jgi:hypothetical protein